MKVEILYDKYNTKIEKATLLFGEDIEQQSIELEVVEEIEGETEDLIITEIVKLTSIDESNIEIENEFNKEDLRVFLTLLRNLLNQLK